MSNKFKVNDLVLYQNGTTFELGVVKEVIEHEKKRAQRQDGLHGEPTGDTYLAYMYRVWYHTGETSALTDEHLLHPIKNSYAFLVLRRSADTSSVDEANSRQLACMLIENSPQLNHLEGDEYFELEDDLTEQINKYERGTY